MIDPVVHLPVHTSEGVFWASYTATGLATLDFPSGRRRSECLHPPERVAAWHRQTTAAIEAILAGADPLELPPLDLSSHTGFRRNVWDELRKLAPGKTQSYGEIARLLGKPRGARAVGGACGANPIPLIIPCHRVLASRGGLGGFSGGLDWKRKLLQREGVLAA